MTSRILDRTQLPEAARLVVKIGSSSLTRADGRLNVPALRRLVDVLAEDVHRGKQIILVSSGAIAAGFMPLGFEARPSDVPSQQAAAAVGQSALMAQYTDAFGAYEITVGQVLMTAADTLRRDRYGFVAQAFDRLIELGAVPIVNENDALATGEVRFGDNDRLAALVAQLVGADAMVLLTDVDGLHTAPPTTPGATRISTVPSMEEVADVTVTGRGSAVGTGGMVTKLQSAEMATSTGIATVLTSADRIGPALRGEDVGTFFAPTSERASRRKVWLEHAAHMYGRLVVDAGAERALRERGASLLAVGIREVHGTFTAGDPIEIVNEAGSAIAHGITSYGSDELPQMLGRSTGEMRSDLGDDFVRSVVHRDELTLLSRR